MKSNSNKPYATIGNITLYHGDCLEIMPKLNLTFDACITDPPYGTTACKWDAVIPFEPMWKELDRLIKNNRAIVLFGTEPFSSYLRCSNIKKFKYDWIWHKSKSGSAFTAKYRPVNKHEIITVFGEGRLLYMPQKTKNSPYKRIHLVSECDINNHKLGFNKKQAISINDGFRYPTTVQFFQQKWRRQDQLHPTQKPVELLEYLIKTYTNEGDTVLDFAAGSGTTGVACMNTNRKCILIEKEEKYCQIITDRLQETLNEKQSNLF